MSFGLEALNSLAAMDPDLVASACEKVMAGQKPAEFRLESFRGPLAVDPAERVILAEAGFQFRPEAVILREVRPPLLVRDGAYVTPSNPVPEVQALLTRLGQSATAAAGIHTAILRGGRIAFLNVPGRGHHGTGWVIRRDTADSAIVVTNRHVAEAFAYADGQGSYLMRPLPNYTNMALELDFLQEHGHAARQDVPLVKVLFIAPSNSRDIALLRVRGPAVAALGLPLEDLPAVDQPREGMTVGVVGYPAFSSDADPADLLAYFQGIFDKKRIGFGQIRTAPAGDDFTHDATTLGGNSGSVVFDADTGALVGLHYGGIAGTANYAVRIDEVLAALHGLEPRTVALGLPPVQPEAVSPAGHFVGRDGYDASFLGTGPLLPPAPGPTWGLAQARDDDTGQPTTELKYRHFSVWMSDGRLLPLITAVNIDGMQSKRLGRDDKWFVDHRLPRTAQIDDAGYKNNPLDRGHMVRREDPVWGALDMAEQANLDSFCFTNAAPQHEGLNQKDWLRLEDYVLSEARARGLKVSVFTGPVFADSDPLYRDLVRIPQAFWKIVAVVDADSGTLSVTGYVLTQGDLIRDLTQEFVYGAFMTYQVPVALIGQMAGLAVDHLAAHDPLPALAVAEGTGDLRFRAVRGPQDLRL